MEDLLKKLNYKDQKRIAVINAPGDFLKNITGYLQGVITDSEIDKRCPYSFMIIFASSASDVNDHTPDAIHNLTADGILWFCYPRKQRGEPVPEINRDKGWDLLNKSGFFGTRVVSVDNRWSAIRFRNKKYIKSLSERYKK